MDLSIILPAHNEENNLSMLHQEILDALKGLGKTFEIIFIDDGSTDRTFDNLQGIRAEDAAVKIIKFKRNFGQTAALAAGFRQARGKVVITMDADMQNDPSDIGALLNKMEQGFDVVSGWRKKRNDSLSKRIISLGANILRKALIKDTIHDSGCTLKAYKNEAVKNLDLYGEMHRFIPSMVAANGFRVGEIVVNHRARRSGQTHYTCSRVLKGFVDMLLVMFWRHYGTRPAHFISGLGFLTFSVGFIVAFWLSFQKIVFGISLSDRPLLLFAALFIIFGTQFVMFGFLADILMKIYYKAKGEPPYLIEKII